MQRRWRMAW